VACFFGHGVLVYIIQAILSAFKGRITKDEYLVGYTHRTAVPVSLCHARGPAAFSPEKGLFYLFKFSIYFLELQNILAKFNPFTTFNVLL